MDLFERTGLRAIEVAECRMGHVRVGRGKTRRVPCDETALSLQAYRSAFGLPPVPLPDEDLPLLLSVRRSRRGELKGISSRSAVWKLIAGLCSEGLDHARSRTIRRCRTV